MICKLSPLYRPFYTIFLSATLVYCFVPDSHAVCPFLQPTHYWPSLARLPNPPSDRGAPNHSPHSLVAPPVAPPSHYGNTSPSSPLPSITHSFIDWKPTLPACLSRRCLYLFVYCESSNPNPRGEDRETERVESDRWATAAKADPRRSDRSLDPFLPRL